MAFNCLICYLIGDRRKIAVRAKASYPSKTHIPYQLEENK
jgi:hypothetical protein